MRMFFPSIAVSAALVLGLSGSALLAQDQPAAGAPPPSAAAPPPAAASPSPSLDAQPQRTPNPARQAKTMARALALTPAQQSAIEPILADRQQQLLSVRSDTTLAPRDRRMKVQAITRDSDSKIEAVLSDTQKQQYQQMKEERRELQQQRRQQQQNGAPPIGNNT
jgi:periplasmic protein CpxP/Spy